MNKNFIKSIIRVFALCACFGSMSAAGQSLDIAQQPLFLTNNVAPNILLAVDDSGSMDFEMLYTTNGGTLWWSNNAKSFNNAGKLYSPTQSEESNYANYVYLFPNGFDNNQKDDRNYAGYTVNCNRSGCFSAYNGSSEQGYHALPPTPEDAFARSSDYNRSYFNPFVEYTPWPERSNVNPSAAPFDPESGSDKLDLTRTVKRSGYQDRFLLADGMTLPAGTKYIVDSSNNWQTLGSDTTVNTYYQIAIQYFPATFYLKQDQSTDLGYTATPLIGQAPDGSRLYGYEIDSDNFASTAQYNSVIQNFANWFTYYRKRQLATRGGIASAFKKAGNLRVGSCTINGRKTLKMLNLDKSRSEFYQSIYDIDFSKAVGTPNRRAFDFLGDQLANNNTIIQQPCQQNFAVLFTDGYTGDREYDAGVGNADGDDGKPYADNKPGNNREPSTLADIARYYYKDLDTLGRVANFDKGKVPAQEGCDADNPKPNLDCNKNLHMVSFGVTLGQQGTIFGVDQQATKDPYANPPNWNNLTLGTYGADQVDDLWHATINSHGSLLNANTPQEVADAFASALQDIASRAGSASSLSINTGTIASDSRLFQASFKSGDWAGELVSRPISSGSGNSTCTALDGKGNGDDVGSICDSEWSAAKQLDTQNWNSGREIITRIDNNAVSFRNKNIPKSMKNAIPSALLQFLRGNRSLEQSKAGDDATVTFRDRKTVLGDIVNSSPVFVGAPDRVRYPVTWTDALNGGENGQEATAGAYRNPTAGSDFVRANSGRTPMVYVGANDGMLHAFDSATGKERLAYIPEAVIGKLGKLGDLNYNHEFYVDGNPIVGDAVINSGGSPKWRSVLVSGLRAGGRSVFALDVTNPANFREANAADIELWEFTDSDLGLTYSEPSIVRLHNGKWAAIFGNGYNSKNQSAVFYVVDLSTGTLLAKLDTKATPGNGNPSTANGLASVFPVDLDGDFITDYVYAGDLYGNLWKFDLTSADPSKWKIGFGTKSVPEPLFTACEANPCTAKNRQPITTKPQVGAHSYGLDYGVMVYFGTGKYLEKGDSAPDTDTQHSFYGIWDGNVFTAIDSPPFATSVTHGFTRSRLTSQSIVSSVDKNAQTFRVLSNNLVQYQQADDNDSATTDGANKRGWMLDLPSGSGEMVVTDATLRGKIVAFSTLIPSETPCEVGGSGFFMVVDAATGGRTDFSALDVNGDRMFNSADKVSVNDKNVTTSGVKIDGGAPGRAGFAIARKLGLDIAIIPVSNASISAIDVNVGLLPQGRRTWQELRR